LGWTPSGEDRYEKVESMIILNCRNGLANRLFYFSHCMALARASGHKTVLSSYLPEAARYFGGEHGAFCVWQESPAWRMAWPNWVRRGFNVLYRAWLRASLKYKLAWPKLIVARLEAPYEISLSNPEFIQMLRSHAVVILDGWMAIDGIVQPEPEAIRAFFTPNRAITEACVDSARKARGEADVLIGVHFRWGDFIDYGDGCFYFSPEVYVRVMKRCEELFPGKRVAFLAVSNEPEVLQQRRAAFGSLRVTLGPGTVAGDLFTLAECDYIVCPASSYSLWAAFHGRKPLWCLADADSLPNLNDFKVYDQTFKGAHPEGSIREKARREPGNLEAPPYPIRSF
jgi:hypothetical protein